MRIVGIRTYSVKLFVTALGPATRILCAMQDFKCQHQYVSPK
jgi:hypothetical protein